MPTKIWLELTNIDVIKDKKFLLKNINLSLKEGEVITLLGPNGSGKSSFIGLINRTLYPVIKKDSHIKIFGKELINIWDLRKNISYVNDELSQRINKNMLTKDLIQSGLYGTVGINKIDKISNIDISTTEKVIHQFGLDTISNEKYHNLSDGQKRNALIARAMVNKPKVLILDEPTINLDMKSLLKLLEILSKLILSNVTILFITNKIDSILKETNRILLIKEGCIIADGKPENIMTSEIINNLYDTNIELLNINGNWRVIPR